MKVRYCESCLNEYGVLGQCLHSDDPTWSEMEVVLASRVAELEAAADEIVAALNEWMGDTEASDQRLEAALARYQAVTKEDEAK